MEIFGKRPFVLKTGELKGKYEAIQPISLKTPVYIPCAREEYVPEVTPEQKVILKADAGIAVTKNWLRIVAKEAKIYKDAQTSASNIRKILSKKTLTMGDVTNLRQNLWTLDITEDNDALPSKSIKTVHDIKNITYPTIPKSFETFDAWRPFFDTEKTKEQIDRTALINDTKKLEESCRKAKQDLKDKFDEVYKLLTSYIKNVQKAYDKSYNEYQKLHKKDDRATFDVAKVKNIVDKGIKAFEKYDIHISQT